MSLVSTTFLIHSPPPLPPFLYLLVDGRISQQRPRSSLAQKRTYTRRNNGTHRVKQSFARDHRVRRFNPLRRAARITFQMNLRGRLRHPPPLLFLISRRLLAREGQPLLYFLPSARRWPTPLVRRLLLLSVWPSTGSRPVYLSSAHAIPPPPRGDV